MFKKISIAIIIVLLCLSPIAADDWISFGHDFTHSSFAKDESGMGTIEVIIIIAVLVSLALIFRNFIMDMAETIFEKIKAKTDSTINTL